MKTKNIIIPSLLSLLSIEAISAISLNTGIIQDLYSELGVNKPIHISHQGLHWRTENSEWGAWHKNNFVDRHVKSCFDVIYNSNNIGARDIENYGPNFSSDSIIALGDSFIEGHGLNHQDTFTSKLQKYSGKKVFNLGTGYQTGPLQYYLIYKYKSSNLPHKTIVMGFLPSNDFTDNDFESISNSGQGKLNLFKKKPRYRPYYDVNNKLDSYPIIYPKDAKKRSNLARSGFHNFIASQSIRLNTIRLYKNLKLTSYVKRLNNKPRYIGHSIEQQNAAIFYIKKTYKLAKSRGVEKFIVLGIPDYYAFQNNYRNKESRPIAKWERDLINFSKKNKDFTFIDGFRILKEDNKEYIHKEFFLSCDGHWSPLGAKLSAEIILESIKN
ncbi:MULTISPECIES: hypothetical protein [unclassified Prochlorococcus]|uniref:hypothetical protein n=1 Tax=unclassified Prochlorococcus TaxID=2627481 RepID=UPI00056C8223|nr:MULTISPECIES: hypothetical protein [unclassified Prochlorococcus]